MNLQMEFVALEAVDKEGAARLMQLGLAIERGTYDDLVRDSPLPSTDNPEVTSTKYRGLVEEWDLLIHKVRQLPTFENFLKPTQYSDLHCATAARPVIIINISCHHCDSLIVTVDHPVQHVPHPDISFQVIRKLVEDLQVAQQDTDTHFENHLQSTLQVLWMKIVSTIMDALSAMSLLMESGAKPHIWWCPTGLLTFLPIHAAGPYHKGGVSNISKTVVSLYTSLGVEGLCSHTNSHFWFIVIQSHRISLLENSIICKYLRSGQLVWYSKKAVHGIHNHYRNSRFGYTTRLIRLNSTEFCTDVVSKSTVKNAIAGQLSIRYCGSRYKL
jgi:hypothetical protein